MSPYKILKVKLQCQLSFYIKFYDVIVSMVIKYMYTNINH
jgi:hypothetical protein